MNNFDIKPNNNNLNNKYITIHIVREFKDFNINYCPF